MKTTLLCSLFLSCIMPFSFAQDAARGKGIYQAKCVTCHGKDALGIRSQEGPRLRGQFDWYIVSSLEKFVKGERKNPKMMPYLKGLSKKDFKDIASYLGQLK